MVQIQVLEEAKVDFKKGPRNCYRAGDSSVWQLKAC